METIHAIYENGVFRPVGPVALPNNCEVEFEPRPLESTDIDEEKTLDKVYEILNRRHRSGHSDTAARHNEHQP